MWGELNDNLYLLEVYREWLEYPELKKKTLYWNELWKPECILIEDKASGQSLIQDIKKEIKTPIISIKVVKDKITRLASVSPFFESGKIFLPKEADWLVDYENELFSFPFSEHDDQVDSTSQFLQWYKNNSKFLNKEIRIRKNQVIQISYKGKMVELKSDSGLYLKQIIAGQELIDFIISVTTKNSLYAFDEQIKNGFIITENGIRIGLCGTAVVSDDKIKLIKNIMVIHLNLQKKITLINCSLRNDII